MSTPDTDIKPNRRSFWIALFIIALPFFWFVPGAIYMNYVTQVENDGCQNNLKELSRGLKEYRQDYDDTFPISASWLDPLSAYVGEDSGGNARNLRCPADHRTEGFSYAMNANLSGKKLSDIKNPHNVILLYETTSKASTPFGRGEDLPRVGKPEVGVGRHHTIGYRFNYYLMADGTVRAPQNLDEVKTYKWTP